MSEDPIAAFRLLDVYSGGTVSEPPRMDAIATISAGRKVVGPNGQAIPQVSRDGTIYLHDPTGRAPGLRAALAQGGGKRLTIAFPFNRPEQFIHQRFAERSATHLLSYGDSQQITLIRNGEHVTYPAGTAEYEAAVRRCRVETNVFFCLARWEGQTPMVWFPDGVGFYRLRMVSRNSVRNILAALRTMAAFTHNRIAGIPFELSLDYRQVTDPSGAQRTVPVWCLVPKPPSAYEITSANFQRLVQSALAQGAALMLPAPAPETLEEAASDLVVVEQDELDIARPGEADISAMAGGGRCDAAYWITRYFALAKGTEYATPEGRARFIDRFTDGRTASLRQYLDEATEAEAAALIEALTELLGRSAPEPAPPTQAEQTVPGSAAPLAASGGVGRRYHSDEFDDGDEAAETEDQPAASPESQADGPAAVVEEPEPAEAGDEEPAEAGEQDAAGLERARAEFIRLTARARRAGIAVEDPPPTATLDDYRRAWQRLAALVREREAARHATRQPAEPEPERPVQGRMV